MPVNILPICGVHLSAFKGNETVTGFLQQVSLQNGTKVLIEQVKPKHGITIKEKYKAPLPLVFRL